MRILSGSRSVGRLFAPYAAISLVPVILLGVGLGVSYGHDARQRGLAEGRSEAALIAETAVAPVLDGHPLSEGLSPAERAGLERMASGAVRGGSVLRMRVRDLNGLVVYADDGSGLNDVPDGEALEAAEGSPITLLTRVNSDTNDSGPRGVAAVEAYQVVYAGIPAQTVGVLEVYLPYTPINADVTAGMHSVQRDVFLGLSALYLVLVLISASVSRGLRRALTRNRFLAQHDALTDLPNRILFHSRAKVAVEAAMRSGRQAVIAIIDLDRFKEVNDTLGHPNGDRLLVEVARRLAECTRPEDTVARLGGDEFGVILRDVSDPEVLLSRLRRVIDAEVDVSGLPVSVEASVGYVVVPDEGTDIDALLQRADVAMYVAKAKHAGVVRYDPAQDQYDAANLSLVAELRHAIEQDELVLHYQPKTALADGTVEAVEALVRWQHPVHGLLAPDRFLPLAEQTDLIDALTYWVLARALRDLRDLGPSAGELAVAVNVSARNLARSDFAAHVVKILDDVGVPATRLIVEITETALLTDPSRAATVLTELATAGVRISLDDFGKGHTSLGYLAALPVHELKIDRAFVSDMLANPAYAAIVRSIVDLGHNLSLRVVGEGVETTEILTRLKDSGCDVAQGYLIARPMPIGQLGPWLENTTDSLCAS
ncbi:MAG: diguanylate cyclase [Actinomycetota bacterium]|nr:diguanylate cyclase [Actinomycetota bacterium]